MQDLTKRDDPYLTPGMRALLLCAGAAVCFFGGGYLTARTDVAAWFGCGIFGAAVLCVLAFWALVG